MRGSYLLAHDLGTSGNKATLFDPDGRLLMSQTISYETQYSNQNWAEQDPSEWWRAVCESTLAIVEAYSADQIGVVSFSGQMMGCLIVDNQGNPLRNHILYSDQRSTSQIQEVIDRVGERKVYQITGHRGSASYGLSKLMWIRDHQPHLYKQAKKMLNAKDYINFKLTGRMVTEYSDASSTNAFDLETFTWSDEILEAARIPQSIMPDLVPSTEVIGHITREAAAATGLIAGTPVVAGAGDGGCSTVGIGSVREGVTYNYIGSSSWISTTSKTVIDDPEMITFTWAHPVPGFLQPCGTMQTAGSSYAWLRDQLGSVEVERAQRLKVSPYKLLDEQVAQSPVGSNGIIFLPYLLGERSPRWNPLAKGAFLGLNLTTTRADIFRSVLEGITLNLAVILHILQQGVDISEMRILGGGAKGLEWQQILADVFGMDILVPDYLEEATSMGAAVIGGVGAGILESFDRIDDFVHIEKRVYPNAKNTQRYREILPLFNEAYERLEPMFR